MSEKRDSSGFPDKETKKKTKLDISSPSGSASEVKQEGDGSVVDDQGSLSPLMENKPRNQDDMDFSYGSVATRTHDHDSVTKETGSTSLSLKESASSSSNNERILLYKKSLTPHDVYLSMLIIPLEAGREFLPAPETYNWRNDNIELTVMDHERLVWMMEGSFDEYFSSYIFWWNWIEYVRKYELQPEDVIFLYQDPSDDSYCFIEYEKKRDSNPVETT